MGTTTHKANQQNGSSSTRFPRHPLKPFWPSLCPRTTRLGKLQLIFLAVKHSHASPQVVEHWDRRFIFKLPQTLLLESIAIYGVLDSLAAQKRLVRFNLVLAKLFRNELFFKASHTRSISSFVVLIVLAFIWALQVLFWFSITRFYQVLKNRTLGVRYCAILFCDF